MQRLEKWQEVRQYFAKRRLRQDEIAAAMGVSRQYVSMMLTGYVELTDGFKWRLCSAYPELWEVLKDETQPAEA